LDNEPTLITSPRDGLPKLANTPAHIVEIAHQLASGHGNLAVDTERASGFTYSQQAQLIQMRRAGSGSFLIDPVALPDPVADLAPLAQVIKDVPWILHAADQDLPCLTELGLRPETLADTLIAGRLLSYKKCNLGNLLLQVMDIKLPKNHSAENWSRRPFPSSWLKYAALDVEFLIELWEALKKEAQTVGRWSWIVEECAYELSKPAPQPRKDPWRKTSQIHRLRSRRELEIVRRIWNSRDRLARTKDLAPGRILPDRMIVSIAQAKPKNINELNQIKGGRKLRYKKRWVSLVDRAMQTEPAQLPAKSSKNSAIPHHSRWKRQHPEAFTVLSECKKVTNAIATELDIDAQDLIAREVLRKLSWAVGEENQEVSISQKLTELKARQWQQQLVAEPLAEALQLPY